ncbi:MAG: hypothetical protein ACRCZY_03360 [Phocaeicola sp.]
MFKSIKSTLFILSGVLTMSSCSKENVEGPKEPTKMTVTFNVDGAGAGTVTKSSDSGTPGSVLSSKIETVTVGSKFLGWYDDGAEITETSTDADVYLSDHNRQLNVKVSGDKTYTATFEKVNADVPLEEDGKCAPRIYATGTGDDAKLMLTKEPKNYGVFFQFGSVIAWDNKAGTTADNVPFNPSEVEISGWNSSWTVGSTFPEHTVENLKAGKGDPCRLVGFSQKYIKEELESGRTPDNGKWVAPTNDQNKEFNTLGSFSNWTKYDDVSGRYLGLGASTGGGEFFPAAGNRKNTDGTLAEQTTRGSYWSLDCMGAGGCYFVNLTATTFSGDYMQNQTFGFSVRCVPQSQP